MACLPPEEPVPGNQKKVHWSEEEILKIPQIGPGEGKASVDRNVNNAFASSRELMLHRVTKTKLRNCRPHPCVPMNAQHRLALTLAWGTINFAEVRVHAETAS